jgi:hypothetical protein
MSIKGSTAFIGQYVFGANSGSPLVVTNNALAQGISYNEVSNTSALAITTTLGVIGSSTVTPVAGTYLVVFSCGITASNTSTNNLSVELYVGGTAQPDTLRRVTPLSGGVGSSFQYINASLNKIVTVNGSQAIAVQAQTSSGTVTVTGLTFDIVRLA